jgi:prolipoprotein diacylglyceryltransferase
LEAGDVIQEINGEPVKDANELNRYLANPDAWRGRSWTMQLTVQKLQGNGPVQLAFAPMTLPIHPTQVYETISMFLLFLLLLAYTPFRRHDGECLALLMIGYGFHRYFNEMLRADVRPTGFENWTSVLLIVAGAAMFLWLRRQPAQYTSDTSLAKASA